MRLSKEEEAEQEEACNDFLRDFAHKLFAGAISSSFVPGKMPHNDIIDTLAFMEIDAVVDSIKDDKGEFTFKQFFVAACKRSLAIVESPPYKRNGDKRKP